MPPPAWVPCELCGKSFGKSSIAIHMKQCIAKREASTSFCPVCDNIVSNDEYERHVGECKIVNAELFKKKKAAEAAATKAAAAATTATGGGKGPAKAGSSASLSVTGSNSSSSGGGGSGVSVVSAAAATGAAQAEKRSKVPEHILAKMREMGEPPEARLHRRLGSPCDACGAVAATVACLGCHAVYCPPCSAGVHESNKALVDHSPVLMEVSVFSCR